MIPRSVWLPPAAVKTIRDVIFYQYAKLIAKEAGYQGNFAFIMSRFQALKSGKIRWSNLTREYRYEQFRGKSCAYCGSAQATQFEHIIPLSRGGPDSGDNLVTVCRMCNASKGDKDLYQWWVRDRHQDEEDVPRVVAGKYLKLIYDMHLAKGTLDTKDLDGDGRATIFDLGAVLSNARNTRPKNIDGIRAQTIADARKSHKERSVKRKSKSSKPRKQKRRFFSKLLAWSEKR